MRIESSSTPTAVTGDVGSVIHMKMSQSVKTILTVVDNIYSDKPRAAIREIVCNAVDAHVAAGIPERPIEVTAPTARSPVLVVRDYGRGMTAEVFENLYQTLGDSTKDERDDLTGAFGIGSKAPLCYTPMFQVTCWSGDGERRCYAIMRDAGNGSPGTRLMDRSVDRDSPTGVEVQIPVNHDGLSEFLSKLKDVLEWIDPPPKIVNSANFAYTSYADFSKHNGADNWIALPGVSEVSVVMGGVSYELDKSKLASWPNVLSLFDSLVFKLPIGSVMPTLSRESLAYNERTVNALTATVENAAASFRKTFHDEAAKATTFIDARRAIKRMIKKWGLLNSYWLRRVEKITWRGRELPWSSVVKLPEGFSVEIFGNGCVTVAENTYTRRRSPVLDGISIDNTFWFYINDRPAGNGGRNAALLHRHTYCRDATAPIFFKHTADGIEEIVNWLRDNGFENCYSLCSQLPNPERSPREVCPDALEERPGWYWPQFSESTFQFRPEDRKLFIESSRMKYLPGHAEYSPLTCSSNTVSSIMVSHFSEIAEMLTPRLAAVLGSTEQDDLDVIAVPPSDVARRLKAGWLRFEDVVGRELRFMIAERRYELALAKAFEKIGDPYRWLNPDWFVGDSPIHRMRQLVTHSRKCCKELKPFFRSWPVSLGVTLPEADPELQDVIAAFEKRYPLLDHFDYQFKADCAVTPDKPINKALIKALRQYIRWCDEAAASEQPKRKPRRLAAV